MLKHQPEYDRKMETFCLLESLLEWDINLEKISFRTNSREQYEQFFKSLIPLIIDLIKTRSKNSNTPPTPSNSTDSILIVNSANSAVDFAIFKIQPQHLFSFLKSICYLFLCVKFEYLILKNLLPDLLELIFNQLLVSPFLYSQVKIFKNLIAIYNKKFKKYFLLSYYCLLL